ncbi:MAG: hypothetical protein HC767_11580 [Akkermansiaceae bacterium]|nr:hypothetical protein [Akkermansiaceae bacterium]
MSHAALRGGMRCADGVWRDITSIEDALAEGCNLFDIDQLRALGGIVDYVVGAAPSPGVYVFDPLGQPLAQAAPNTLPAVVDPEAAPIR